MPDKPFVINDRRKFTSEGELRPEAEVAPREEKPSPPAPTPEAERPRGPQAVPPPAAAAESEATELELPPPPTDEQVTAATRAYDATVDRLDTAIRASNPGAEAMPPINFATVVQSIYMQAILQLGGAAEPGQQPQIDVLGARQSIDMLGVIAEKARGNLSDDEQRLIDSALFEMRMGFLEVTQAIARQAAARQGMSGAPGSGGPGSSGPSIVR
jgi:hypothetical protein